MTKIPNKTRYKLFVSVIVILMIGICLPLGFASGYFAEVSRMYMRDNLVLVAWNFPDFIGASGVNDAFER